MFGRLKDMLTRGAKVSAEVRIRTAAATLLVEAAVQDGLLVPAERDRVEFLLRERFGLSPAEATELFTEGCQSVADSVQVAQVAKAIRDNLDEAERIRMIEMLWEVAYADGRLHEFEGNLVRRVCGLIQVSGEESGAARKRAMTRLGIPE